MAQPRECEVVEEGVNGASRHDNFRIRLQGNRCRPLKAAPEISGHFAACAESSVEGAIAVVADQRDRRASVDLATPAATSFPSGCTATAAAASPAPAKSVVTLPRMVRKFDRAENTRACR